MPGVKRTPLEIGRKFGYLTVLGDGKDKREGKQTVRMVHVECICGVEKEVRYSTLMYEMVKSCGCKSKEMSMETMERNNKLASVPMPVTPRQELRDRFEQHRKALENEIRQMESDLISGRLKDISPIHTKTREYLDLKFNG